ncbi:MAG: DNA-3-methyladenine glycosylase 2 family protein [Nannocystaceae bacterium]|nr:DNA-3-methyladenine glycosylase 2 family protein [Nannocystaceae bacterium]
MTEIGPSLLDTPVPDLARVCRHLRQADPRLSALIELVGPCRLEVAAERDTFAALSKAIVYQQLTGKAAATIYGRLCAAAAGRSDRAFAPAQLAALDDASLRAAGLSRSKLLALRDLAARTSAGEVPSLARLRRMPDEAIIDVLTRVRGIGRWSAQMLLIFRLGRLDVLPVDDYGVRKGFARLLGRRQLPLPAQLERRAERWRPYRSIASWYMWRATELPADVRVKPA